MLHRRQNCRDWMGKLDLFVLFGLVLRMDWKFLLKANSGNLIG